MKRTPQALAVADLLLANPTEPVFNRQLSTTLGYGTGTVHAILQRMIHEGWVTDEWDPPGSGRTPRRLYRIAGAEGLRQLTHYTQTRRQP